MASSSCWPPPPLRAALRASAAILVAYLLSAILTGWAFRADLGLVGSIPTLAVLLAAAYGALRN